MRGSVSRCEPRQPRRSIAALRRIAGAAAIWVAAAAPGQAQDAASLAQQHLYAGTLRQGAVELTRFAAQNPDDPSARFALGGLKFVIAVEQLAQSLHRHGLEAPRSINAPILRLPVPPNPRPEPLTYEGFRNILERFADDLGAAERTLAEVGEAQVKLPLDLARIHLDLNGDGRIQDDERLWSILARLDLRAAGAPESLLVTFDTGDVLWLRGYARLLMGTAEFWLAHDFRPMFEQSFQLFFPRAQLPFAPGPAALEPSARENVIIADAIVFVHLFNWPVVEPERLPRAVAHWRAVASLSRQSWAAILAETDDEHEWLPNPRQSNLFPSLPVGQDRIDAWLAVMDELDAVLEGRKLVPHWRFAKGFNLRRALLEHKTFDPVMWIAGPGIVPFLEDGPTITSDAWNQITRTIQGNFFAHAVRFN